MNLRDLTYIVAIAEHGNFTRAAEAVSVSQPALSSQVKKVERELGVPIFERSPRGIVLTEFGARAVEAARQVNALVRGIDEMASHYRGTEAGPLRLGLTPTLAGYLTGYFRDLFARIAPDLRLVIVEDVPQGLSRSVEAGRIDFALVARRSHVALSDAGAHPPHLFTPLWLEPAFLAMREGHALSAHGAIRARDVPRDQLIRFSVPFGYDLEADLPDPCPAVAERVGIDVRSARFETICRHLPHCDAVTMVNGVAAAQFARDGMGLTFVPFHDDGDLRELGAITRPGFARQSLVEAAQAQIQASPPRGTRALAAHEAPVLALVG